MFRLLYFGICCCQEELQRVHKVSKADAGCLQPSFSLSHAPPGVRHGLWGLPFCSLLIWNGVSSYFIWWKLSCQIRIMAEARSNGLFFSMWQVCPRLSGHTSQHSWENFPLAHKFSQLSKFFSCCPKLKYFPFVFKKGRKNCQFHTCVLTLGRRKRYLILTCIIFNSCTSSAKQESDQNIAHCF